MEFTARQIAAYVNGDVVGNDNAAVSTFSKIEEGKPGSLTFLSNPKYTNYIYDTDASIVLVSRQFVPERPVKATLIKVDDPYDTLARLMSLYEASKPRKTGIDPLAFVSPTAQIGEGVYAGPFAYIGDGACVGDGARIYPHAYIGDNVRVGEGTTIYSGVNIYEGCVVGRRCVLHSGVVIGADGFGFAPTHDGYEKIPQIGNVVIEDDVEIGANTCIDRATMGSTYVRHGVKLDNLIQVAHNDEIGANTVMAAQTGIAGSTKIGEWCKFGGQVGIAGHITIGDHVNAGAQTGVPSSVKSGRTIMGTPAVSYMDFLKISVIQRKLPEINNRLEKLQEELMNLKNSLNK